MLKKIYEKVKSRKMYFIIILTILSSLNIFHSGIICGDDINFHLHRIIAVVDNIKIAKNIPVYYNYLNGFGYANGLFYPDLFLFVPAILNYFGLNLFLSLKIFIFIINFFSIYTMYLCVYKITKEKKCAYCSMFLYAISNYRLVDFVVRGALGEMISFVFLPLVVLGFYELFYGNYKEGYYLTIGLVCLCFSHIISFYLMCFFSILFIIINIKCLKETERLKSLIKYILLTLLITVHFWLPLIEQLLQGDFNIMVNSKIFDNIIPLYLLFFDLPIFSFDEYYPVGIGLVYYISLIKFIKKVKSDSFLFTIMFFGIISILFSSIKLIWEIDLFYKLFSVIQFPWRFYMFSSLFFVIGFSIILKSTGINKYFKFCFIYLVIVFICNVCLYSFNVYLTKPLENQVMFGEYMPKDFDAEVITNYVNDDILFERDNNILNITVLNNKKEVEVPLIYYKGYKACSDKCYQVFKTSNEMVGIKLDDGVKSLKVWYAGTRIYNITKYLSVFGVLILIYVVKKYIH